MLRSFACAAAAARRNQPKSARRRLAFWEAQTSRTYLDTYLDAAAGAAFCTADRTAAEQVVRLFTLEKALYEVAYELANRPDWVAIPLRGVLALLDSEATPAVTKRVHRMPFGAEIQPDGEVRFRNN
jgi:predicted trehalose synthase